MWYMADNNVLHVCHILHNILVQASWIKSHLSLFDRMHTEHCIFDNLIHILIIQGESALILPAQMYMLTCTLWYFNVTNGWWCQLVIITLIHINCFDWCDLTLLYCNAHQQHEYGTFYGKTFIHFTLWLFHVHNSHLDFEDMSL